MGSAVGDREKSTEDVEIPRSLSFFRDNLVSTVVAMLIVYLIFAVIAGPAFVAGLSEGANPFVYAVVQALTFAAGVWVILVGVRMILGEIVLAFEGISQKIIPNAVPALDIPIVFPYAPTAVPIGFIASATAGVVALPILGPLGLALIIPGMVPHFFVGGGAGVFGNATGGRRGAVLGAFANGLIITFPPYCSVIWDNWDWPTPPSVTPTSPGLGYSWEPWRIWVWCLPGLWPRFSWCSRSYWAMCFLSCGPGMRAHRMNRKRPLERMRWKAGKPLASRALHKIPQSGRYEGVAVTAALLHPTETLSDVKPV